MPRLRRNPMTPRRRRNICFVQVRDTSTSSCNVVFLGASRRGKHLLWHADGPALRCGLATLYTARLSGTGETDITIVRLVICVWFLSFPGLPMAKSHSPF